MISFMLIEGWEEVFNLYKREIVKLILLRSTLFTPLLLLLLQRLNNLPLLLRLILTLPLYYHLSLLLLLFIRHFLPTIHQKRLQHALINLMI